MSKPHRGRIQAQGKGLEKSVSWSQDEPLTRKQGKTLLQQLKALLTAQEHEERTEQLEKRNATSTMPMELKRRKNADF